MKLRVLGLVAIAPLALSPPAGASTLITRGASDIALTVNGAGMALVTYEQAGVRKRVLAWGAINDDVTLSATRSQETAAPAASTDLLEA